MVTRRAELGQWNTAAPVAQLAIAALGGIAPGARVIDPTCGDGAFLAAALASGAREVVGVEIDPIAAARARSTSAMAAPRSIASTRGTSSSADLSGDPSHSIGSGRGASGIVDVSDDASHSITSKRGRGPLGSVVIVESDVLAPGLVDRLGLFDVAIGNPPYVRAGRVDPAIKRERARVLAADWPELDADVIDSLARHADFAATCLLRTLRFVRPGGQLALVVSTALLDADGASSLWTAIARVAHIEALIAAPAERWFADAAVNSMLLVARRHAAPVRGLDKERAKGPVPFSDFVSSGRTTTSGESPRILRLSRPTRDVANDARCLDDIASFSEERCPSTGQAPDENHGRPEGGLENAEMGSDPFSPDISSSNHGRPMGGRETAEMGSDPFSPEISSWGPALRAPAVWFAWREKAGAHLVPLRELCEVRRGLTTGANDVFYVRRDEAKRLRLEPRFLAPVVRSPFNGAPAPIAIAPDESPLVAIAVPRDAKLARAPRIAAWFAKHEATALATSAARRDPWWSLPVHPARLFFAKAYGPRFVQRLADTPMLADQRVYALHPRPGVDLVALAAVLNALPTALALESLGRGSMGYGAVEWTVHDALELPVLDVRHASARVFAELHTALAAIARRPVSHVRLERDDTARARLDRAVLALAPGGELVDAMWDGLCASVAQRDRYLLPTV